MAVKKKPLTIIDYAIKGIEEKKGKEIVKLDLRKIPNSITNYFIVCHGTSKPHIEAIAESVEEFVRKNTGEKPLHKEGYANAEWILIDYFDVVIHIFQEVTRKFYKLEDLWADAEIEEINSKE